MFSLIRRFSHSVIPRPDRPWADDPTSNAPSTRKRRRSSAEFDPAGPPSPPSGLPNGHSAEDSATAARGEDGEASAKKIRREDSMDVSESGPSPSPPLATTNPSANKRKGLGERYPIWGFSLGLGRPQARSQQPSETPQTREQQETEDVKAVTQGVQEVEIHDKDHVVPESVPLPTADDDDLEEGKEMDGDGDVEEDVKHTEAESTKVEVEAQEKVEEHKQTVVKPDEGQTNDDDDVASSANGEEDEIQEIPAPAPVHVEEAHPTGLVAQTSVAA